MTASSLNITVLAFDLNASMLFTRIFIWNLNDFFSTYSWKPLLRRDAISAVDGDAPFKITERMENSQTESELSLK